MDKKEACHTLAEISEEIYDLEKSLSNIEIRLFSDGDKHRDWYLEKKEEVIEKLERLRAEHDEFYSQYYDIINS